MATKLSKTIAKGLILSVLIMNALGGIGPLIATQVVHAETTPLVENVDYSDASATDSALEKLAPCTLLNTDFSGCLAQALYTLVFKPVHWFTGIAASFLDIFISYSINSESYRQNQFVEKGWSVVRDVTNIVFIFGLMLIAFSLVLGTNVGSNPKKLFINIVIFGLLINFSLFFTRVIIDGGNILATVFYNNMHVKNEQGTEIVGQKGEKQISLAIVAKSNPQKLFASMPANEGDTGKIALVILTATLFNIGLIVVFISVGYLFIGRVVSLMILMIFSPLAFASKVFPAPGKLKQFSWGSWISNTASVAFMAPMFLFFLYLITLFQDAQNALGYPSTGNIISVIIGILLPYAITYTLLMEAKKLTKSMSNDVGLAVADGLNKVTSVVSNAALTGGAIALTGGLGAAGGAAATKFAGQTGVKGAIGRLGQKAATSNFDFRSSRLGKLTQKAIKQGGGKISLGAPTKLTQGGLFGVQQRITDKYVAKQEKEAKAFTTILPGEKFAKDVQAAELQLRNAQGIKDAEYDAIKKDLDDLRDKRKGLEEELKIAKQGKDQDLINDIKGQLSENKGKQDTTLRELHDTKKFRENKLAQVNLKQKQKALKDEVERRKGVYTEKIMKSAWNQMMNPTATSTMWQEATDKIRGKAEANEEFNKKLGKAIEDKDIAKEEAEKKYKNEIAGLERKISEQKTSGNEQEASRLEKELALVKEQREVQIRNEDILRQEERLENIKEKMATATSEGDEAKLKDLTSQFNKLSIQNNNVKIEKIQYEQTKHKETMNNSAVSADERSLAKERIEEGDRLIGHMKKENEDFENKLKAK